MSIGSKIVTVTLTTVLASISSATLAQTAVPVDTPHPAAAALQPFIDGNLISGAVFLVATKDKIVDEEAVGFADTQTHKPMTTDALFQIASMSKAITVTALMMLVEEGKVNIDDPVEKYLPEFKGQMYVAEKDDNHILLKKPDHPKLVRELMCHTSGLAKIGPMGSPKRDSVPLATLVRSYALSPLESQPGTHYNYSDDGINTVGRIIEVVSGEPYEKFLQDRLFTPLGMKDTTFFPNSKQLARLASLYAVESGPARLKKLPIGFLTYPLDGPGRYPSPAAGLFSTTGDIAKFCQMILSGGTFHGKQYLSKATVDFYTSRHTPDAVGAQRAYPWALNLGKDHEAFGHGGAFRTYMILDPKVNLIGILMEQHDGGWTTSAEWKVYPTFIQKMYDVGGIPASVEHSPEP
jgi:CubicO group peptidase (beta-lactamase class C family)